MGNLKVIIMNHALDADNYTLIDFFCNIVF